MIDDFGPYHRLSHRYHADLIALWGEANRQFQTDKAKINCLIKIIPRLYRIDRFVLKKEDKTNLKQAMLLALKEGFWIGLRSSYLYQPLGKAPWIMGMKSRKGVQRFFSKPKKDEQQIWLGTKAHYNEWRADRGLKEIIVMFNPPLLCPQYEKEHFVGRVEIFGPNLRTEIRLNTDQMRDADSSVPRNKLIIINMALKDTFRFEKRPITTSFGRSYFRKKTIKPNVLKISKQIINTLFNDWCQAPFNLYYRLQALREFGLGTLEFQGRIKNNEIDWMRIYGFRGVREVANLTGRRYLDKNGII